MRNLPKWVIVGAGIGTLAAMSLLVVRTGNSQPPASTEAEPAAPAGQTYIGVKRCSSCHFKQYISWKKTKHATDAWDLVPAQYRTSAECLPCHSTGYGQPSGFKDESSTANLKGNTCESCHGPGSKHEEACKPYLNKKKLAPEEEKIARDSIYKVLPGNVCASCHTSKGHKDHPKYQK